MNQLSHELEEARDKVGNEYCTSCFVRGMVDDGDPNVVMMEVRWTLLGERPYREDIQLKCPECKDTRQKGFGLTESEFEDKLDRRGGNKFLDVYSLRDKLESVNEDLLKSLGYKDV